MNLVYFRERTKLYLSSLPPFPCLKMKIKKNPEFKKKITQPTSPTSYGKCCLIDLIAFHKKVDGIDPNYYPI